MTTLLIADDHPLFREALRGVALRLLPGARIREAENADALYAMVDAEPDADLLLLDLNMPGTQGFSALVHLRAAHPQLPVAMVSAREEPEVMRRALDHGAMGFIPKSSDAATLATALQQVLDGERWVPDAALSAAPIADDERAIAAINGKFETFDGDNRAKLEAYECGIEPTPTPAGGGRFPIKYYLTAMLFIVFDIEIVFLYPWAVTFDALGLFGLVEMLLFVLTVFVAYAYVWRRGGLEWD